MLISRSNDAAEVFLPNPSVNTATVQPTRKSSIRKRSTFLEINLQANILHDCQVITDLQHVPPGSIDAVFIAHKTAFVNQTLLSLIVNKCITI